MRHSLRKLHIGSESVQWAHMMLPDNRASRVNSAQSDDKSTAETRAATSIETVGRFALWLVRATHRDAGVARARSKKNVGRCVAQGGVLDVVLAQIHVHTYQCLPCVRCTTI